MERPAGSFGSWLLMKFHPQPVARRSPAAVAHLVLVRSILVRYLIIALLLSGCTSITSVRGRYAATLSPADIQQIRRFAQKSPHLGHTSFTFEVPQRDEVHVRTREYLELGSEGEDFYVCRRNGRWVVDKRHPRLYTPERIVVTS
jgi:hypothetical protein